MILKILKLLSGAMALARRAISAGCRIGRAGQPEPASVCRDSTPRYCRNRILLVACGVAMVFGGLGAARDGCPRAAAVLVGAGLFLATAALRLGGRHAATTAALLHRVSGTSTPLDHPKPLNPKSPASRLRAGWCQGALARDREGRPVFPGESAAAAWSLLGAVAASHDSPEWADCFARLRCVLGVAPSVSDTSARWLAKWNDDPSRTQADVVAVAEAVEGSSHI